MEPKIKKMSIVPIIAIIVMPEDDELEEVDFSLN